MWPKNGLDAFSTPLLDKHALLAGRKADGLADFGEPLLTVGEVATLMRVSNMTVYRLIKAGQLAAIRVGKNYRIRRSDVSKYLADRSVIAGDS